MPHIQVLDQITVDKIAAGEVIERPASVIKELVENAIDAGADSITVEIRDGGISFIRVADNGCGIPQDEVRKAFLRHSTSKIRTVEDLAAISSLGFRGEALSSIAAVTKTELITKTKDAEFGTRYVIEGGKELSLEDTGASDGTNFVVRQLFYNVPARRKFLKTPMTEAGHVQDLMTRLSLSHPEVGFLFLNNGQEKLRTSGNGKLKDVIYNVYGRDVAANLLEIDYEKNGFGISGYLGKPVISRGNRNFENFFVNGRYVKSPMISKSLEDAYRDFSMQHKFPFAVLHFHVKGDEIDINVHPTKMELRFQRQQEVYNTVFEGVHRTLLEPELIQRAEVPDPVSVSPQAEKKSPFLLKPKNGYEVPAGKPAMIRDKIQTDAGMIQKETGRPAAEEAVKSSSEQPAAESARKKETDTAVSAGDRDEEYFIRKMRERVLAYHQRSSSAEVPSNGELFRSREVQTERIREQMHGPDAPESRVAPEPAEKADGPEKQEETGKPVQLGLFEENFLKRDVRAEYKLIGQVFETYWLVEYRDSLYIIDQHAAHERVLYEKTLKGMKNREFTSQYLSPPIILSLSMQEAEVLNTHMDRFARIGFEIEPFGGEEFAVRAVPDNLFGIAKKDLLMEMLDSLSDGLTTSMTPELIDEKVASMSCKAAVKGNNKLSAQEMDALIGELLSLDNPYHCPHGRPTIIAMTKRELEKKFKRIV